MDLVKSLVTVSEKAANIARKIRENDHLFDLLVQKKRGDESNPRFVEDFKTLADVLIQEMVRNDISKQFPVLQDRIHGEESNVFSNKLGRSIRVELREDEAETTALLREVLNGDEEAARLLAMEAHRSLSLDDVNTSPLPPDDFSLDLEECAIWIDPIDSTAEYINGITKLSDTGICVSGLQCATVLIGVYNTNTKKPVIGVINQPFSKKVDSKWQGTCFWGICTGNYRISWEQIPIPGNNIISLSSSEDSIIKEKLEKNDFKLIEAAGAGYKMLTVLNGSADAYIMSKDTTYKWDTCAPHAILRSLGGEVLIFTEALEGNKISVEYPSETEYNSNCGGLFAFRDEGTLNAILQCLAESRDENN